MFHVEVWRQWQKVVFGIIWKNKSNVLVDMPGTCTQYNTGLAHYFLKYFWHFMLTSVCFSRWLRADLVQTGLLGGEDQGGGPGVRHQEGAGGVQQPAQALSQPRRGEPRDPALPQPQALPGNSQNTRENRARWEINTSFMRTLHMMVKQFLFIYESILNRVSCFRPNPESRWVWGLGSQQVPGAPLRQLAHPGRAQLAHIQRVQDPARLQHAGVQLGPGQTLLHHQGPRRLWRTLWPSLSATEFRQGLGRLLCSAVCRVLPLLAGDHAHATEMKWGEMLHLEKLYTVWSQCAARDAYQSTCENWA